MKTTGPGGAAVLIAMFAAGCGGGDEAAGGAASASGDAGAKVKDGLKLGDETTLKGLKGEMKVRVMGIEDPMKNPATERPKKGRRFVGVRIELTNVGDEPYKDSAQNGSRLVTSVKKASNPTILLSGKCPSNWGIKLRIAPGKSKRGCLPFQVKKGAKVTGFQFRLNSGFGPEMGSWERG